MQDKRTVSVLARVHGRTASTLLAAAALAALAACDAGTDAPPALPSGPSNAERGAEADIDISARSSEATRAAQNRAATTAGEDGSGTVIGGDTSVGAETAQGNGDRSSNAAAQSADEDAAVGDAQIAAIGTSPVRAHAMIEPTEGNEARGDASFIETEDGLEIVVSMTGMTPGEHGIHIHEQGDCSGPAAEAAGDHFNPDDTEHGAPEDDPTERHAGDLGNLSADAEGNARLTLTMSDLTLEGERGIVGRAIITHQSEDDLTSQPSGDSGDPAACGVIEARGRA